MQVTYAWQLPDVTTYPVMRHAACCRSTPNTMSTPATRRKMARTAMIASGMRLLSCVTRRFVARKIDVPSNRYLRLDVRRHRVESMYDFQHGETLLGSQRTAAHAWWRFVQNPTPRVPIRQHDSTALPRREPRSSLYACHKRKKLIRWPCLCARSSPG